MVAADCLRLFGAMASETTWLTHILYMTTDCHYVVVQLSYLTAALQRDDISLSLASKWYRCLHRSREVFILAVAPCQPLRDTVSYRLRGFSARRRLAAPAECWKRHLAGEIGHLRSFSPTICRLQPVRQALPRGGGDLYWQQAVPSDGGETSRVAPFRAEMGTFLFWSVHLGMSDGCIVGFATLVYCCYCLTDLSNLFCGAYNIYICMMILHFCVFCPDKVKMMYQQYDVLMETVKMHCQKMYMMWNKPLWKKYTIYMYYLFFFILYWGQVWPIFKSLNQSIQ